jgi:hypothetical protein
VKKSSAIRLAGFVGALCASGALIGTAVSGTGAYFTDAHSGSINATTGDVKVNTSDLSLNFNGLLPGNYKTQDIGYQATGTSAEDIWLVFPTDGSAEAFTGKPDDTAGGGLGRYGHFALTSTGGASFVSNNLSNPGTTTGHTGPLCGRDANGWGGSSALASSKSDIIDFCAPSNAILLQSNMNPGDSGHATLEFGFTQLLTNGRNSVGNLDNHNEDATIAPLVKYSIVATQHGVRPDDPNNDPQS